jgi:hypothetical protein
VGTKGVPFHVAADRQEMLVRLDRERLEPSLIQVTGASRAVVGVPPLGVGHGEPAQELREVALLARPAQEMEMVGHHAGGQQPGIRARDGLSENSLERGLVLVGLEDG